ncbi:hypothetical protein T01_706 [Trichinella spiralis]|uniref:Uncharacterized protein n=1 Tax=Trichinella spiralis TaxID=6334 RepID=A0A0V1BRZ3_TRISP|nr:hypothetical protein T01_706 [Trichinella spiralis]
MCEGGRLESSEDDHDGRLEIKRDPAPYKRFGIGCALVTPNSWEAGAAMTERDLFQSERGDGRGDVWRCILRMSTRRRDRASEKEQAQSDGGRTGEDPEADPPAPPRRVVTPVLLFLRAQIHTYHSSPRWSPLSLRKRSHSVFAAGESCVQSALEIITLFAFTKHFRLLTFQLKKFYF